MVLAGCGGAGAPEPVTEDLHLPALEATATTGVIRGVVVDDAIRPLANATVTVRGDGGVNRTSVTGADGFFGFKGLAPGTWFVAATKLAHEPAQATTEVVAGVGEPPVVRLMLSFVPSEAPYAVSFKVEGFVECIVPGANVCFILNFYPCLLAGYCDNVTNDNSVFHVVDPVVAAQRIPDWAQIEMVWESTQALTDWLSIRVSPYSWDDGAGVDDRAQSALSPSPLVFTINGTTAADWDLGTSEGFALETFSGGNDETCGGLPVRACTGVQLNQRVDYFFHLFYGYAPPEGWRFSEDGEALPPR